MSCYQWMLFHMMCISEMNRDINRRLYCGDLPGIFLRIVHRNISHFPKLAITQLVGM